MTEHNPILDVLEDLRKQTDTDQTCFGDIVDGVEERGYGPLIMVLSAFVILPTGAIPGVPAVIGLALLLIAAQLLWGRDVPWLPDRLRRFEIDNDTLKTAVDKARPWAERLSKIVRRRLTFLCNGPVANRAISLCVVLASVAMIPLGFIPFMPMVLGVSLFILGIGMTARDGAAIAIGYAIFGTALYVALTMRMG